MHGRATREHRPYADKLRLIRNVRRRCISALIAGGEQYDWDKAPVGKTKVAVVDRLITFSVSQKTWGVNSQWGSRKILSYSNLPAESTKRPERMQ
jgi:hypothetical protein